MTDIINDRATAGVEVIAVAARTVVGLSERVTVEDLADFFARAIPAVSAELARQGIVPDGPPVAVYRHEGGHRFDVTVGFPVGNGGATTDALVVEELPAGRVVRAEHVGSYDTLAATYARLSHWFSEHRLPPPDVMWEEYLVGPGAVDESEFRTRVTYPVP